MTPDGAAIYADRAEITEDLIHQRGENVTLYAVWEKQEENGGDTGNSGETGDNGEAGGTGKREKIRKIPKFAERSTRTWVKS